MRSKKELVKREKLTKRRKTNIKEEWNTRKTNLPAVINNNDPFPLSNDKLFQSLPETKRKFIYNVFLKPLTRWSLGKCYAEAFDRILNKYSPADAHLLLKEPKIKYCVDRLKAIYQNNLFITVERILEEEAAIAYSDIKDLFEKDGRLITSPSKMPETARRAISSFKVIEKLNGGTEYHVTLWSKSDALKRIENILGMTQAKKLEVSGPNGGPIPVAISSMFDVTNLSYDERLQLKALLEKCKK